MPDIDAVMCPVSPELVEQLRRPGGVVTRRPVQMWLDANNIINVKELSDFDELEHVLWPELAPTQFDGGRDA
jgi:hypothetical protein